MRKYLVSGLIALAAPALLVTPADAAVPQTKPDQTVACDGAGHVASVWFAKNRLAVDATDCTGWVGYVVGTGSGASLIAVAPGAHFNRHGVAAGGTVRQIASDAACDGWWDSAVIVWPGHHGAFESPATAPQCDGIY